MNVTDPGRDSKSWTKGLEVLTGNLSPAAKSMIVALMPNPLSITLPFDVSGSSFMFSLFSIELAVELTLLLVTYILVEDYRTKGLLRHHQRG